MLSYQNYVQLVKQEIQQIDVQTLHQQAQANSLLIDIREPEELKQGSLNNAKHIPRGLLEAKIFELPPFSDLEESKQWLAQQNIALICASGARSALAAKSLQEMGLTNVVSVAGGVNAWKAKGYPISQ